MKRLEYNQNMDVSLIIPNYNGLDLLQKYLPGVVDAYRNINNNIKEIIIVDDGSGDGSVKFVKKNYPEIKIIQHKKNRGFSVAVNAGVRAAKGDLVCLLNTDVIPEPDFLSATLKYFTDKDIFAVSFHEKGYGPAVGRFINGFVQHSGGAVSQKLAHSFWVNGGSGLFRKRYWNILGGFDERLFSPYYWEDVDICYRAQKRGWKVMWDPDAHVTHIHESTMKKLNPRKKAMIQERNQLLFIWKNITSPSMFRKHLPALLKRISEHPGYALVLLMALKKYRNVAKARAREKRESKISDEMIFSKFK